MRIYVEPPERSWGARQRLATALARLGYRVDLYGAGDDWVLLIS